MKRPHAVLATSSMLLALASLSGLGCGSSAAPAVLPEVSGTYGATGSGALAEIAFPDATHYTLEKSNCAGALCASSGTYAFNAAGTSLELTDAVTKQTTSMPFTAGRVEAPPGVAGIALDPVARRLPGSLAGELSPLGGGTLGGDASTSLVTTTDGGVNLLSRVRQLLVGFGLGGQTFSLIATPLFSPPGSGKCRYPILLEHGFAGANTTSSPWGMAHVAADLTAAGHALVVADEVEPFGSVQARAATMFQTMKSLVARCKNTQGCDPSGVHVIAHSYGGLHSREYLLEHPPANAAADGAPPVLDLTTISTPNYGTNIADVGIAAVKSGGSYTAAIASFLSTAFASTFTSAQLAGNGDIAAALQTMSEANAPAFAASHPAVAGVHYFAWAGMSVNPPTLFGDFPSDCDGRVFAFTDAIGNVHDYSTSLVLQPIHLITGHGASDLPNDGMATIASAKALPGSTFMGCFPADHLGDVGTVSTVAKDWTGFDNLTFYRSIASSLAALEPAP